MDRKHTAGKDSNPDPITGAPGAHPVGVGIGSAGAGATGAAIGAAVAGPVGAVVGGAVGAVAGGLAGKGVAEKVNPTVEDAYWKSNYRKATYVKADRGYDYYQPAYRYGWESYAKHPGKKWDDVEPHLASGWEKSHGTTAGMKWDEAKLASKDAWHRLERGLPGDADHDGR